MKVAFFDTKPYDVPGFDHYAAGAGLEIKYFETRLNGDTVSLASGFDAVCVFVNDTVDSAVVEKLYEMGVKVIALRCAGFNNVDIRAASGKLPVYRVPASAKSMCSVSRLTPPTPWPSTPWPCC